MATNPGGSCPLDSAKTGWPGPPAERAELSWGITGDGDRSVADVEIVGDMGRLMASSARRRFAPWGTNGVACGVCD